MEFLGDKAELRQKRIDFLDSFPKVCFIIIPNPDARTLKNFHTFYQTPNADNSFETDIHDKLRELFNVKFISKSCESIIGVDKETFLSTGKSFYDVLAREDISVFFKKLLEVVEDLDNIRSIMSGTSAYDKNKGYHMIISRNLPEEIENEEEENIEKFIVITLKATNNDEKNKIPTQTINSTIQSSLGSTVIASKENFPLFADLHMFSQHKKAVVIDDSMVCALTNKGICQRLGFTQTYSFSSGNDFIEYCNVEGNLEKTSMILIDFHLGETSPDGGHILWKLRSVYGYEGVVIGYSGNIFGAYGREEFQLCQQERGIHKDKFQLVLREDSEVIDLMGVGTKFFNAGADFVLEKSPKTEMQFKVIEECLRKNPVDWIAHQQAALKLLFSSYGKPRQNKRVKEELQKWIDISDIPLTIAIHVLQQALQREWNKILDFIPDIISEQISVNSLTEFSSVLFQAKNSAASMGISTLYDILSEMYDLSHNTLSPGQTLGRRLAYNSHHQLPCNDKERSTKHSGSFFETHFPRLPEQEKKLRSCVASIESFVQNLSQQENSSKEKA